MKRTVIEPSASTTDALRQAILACRDRKGVTLRIPPGDYILQDEEAVELRDRVMAGLHDIEALYKPYIPYVKGLEFRGCEDLLIEARGVRLFCEGWMQPLAFEDCRNVTLKGMSIDYRRKPFSIGKVVKRTLFSFDVALYEDYPVGEGVPCPRIEFWMPDEERLYPKALYVRKSRYLGDRRIRIYHPPPPSVKNMEAMIVHSLHFRPAVFLNESEDLTLDGLTIHSQPGMGIVGNRCENISLNRVDVLPSPGLHMSTNTDATHFTSCKGLIRFDHCRFEGQGDDSTNIHNFYYSLNPVAGALNSCEIRVPVTTHAQLLDYPDPGDTLEILEKKTLKTVSSCKVLSVENFPEDGKSIVHLDCRLPGKLKDYLLLNVTRMPAVEIVNCSMRNHLARGLLIKTRNVLIEGCTFENTTGTAIHVGAEIWWHEGHSCRDLIIRNNNIRGCGRGSGRIDGASAIALTLEAKKRNTVGMHKRILIENNRIDAHKASLAVLIRNAEDVVLKGNRMSGARKSVKIKYSRHVEMA